MAVGTVAGTLLYIAAEQPLTFTEAGYEDTGMDWTAIGEITDAGEHGREYAVVTHMPIATRGTQKFKGSFNEGTKSMSLAINDADAGQVILKAAVVSDNDYSFKVLYPDNSADYFQAKVMSFKKQATTVDSVRAATVTLEITTSSAGVGIIEAAAP